MKKRIQKKPSLFILIVTGIAVLLLIEGGILLLKKSPVKDASASSIEELASQIVETCKNKSYRPTCYDEEIPKVMDKPHGLSMEDAFKVTVSVQDFDPEYQYCHVLGHELSAKEVRKDPAKWKDVITRCPSGVCSNGCLHGGFQEKFRKESLDPDEVEKVIPDLKSICEARGKWNPTGLEQASCYHALGHLTMYITAADINKSLELCDIAAVKDDGRNFLSVCYDGVFMQIYQPLEPEDIALVQDMQPGKNEVDSFCQPYTGQAKASCLSESWPLFIEEISTPEGFTEFCGKQENGHKNRCYSALTYVLTPRLDFNVEKLTDFCSRLPEESAPVCFADAASRMIETDYRNTNKSVEMCQAADEYEYGEKCFSTLLTYASFNFHKGSEGSVALCNAMPEEWKRKCLSN